MEFVFKKLIDSNFIRTRINDWLTVPSSGDLPTNKIFMIRRDLSTKTVQNQFDAGITHIDHFDLPWDNPSEVSTVQNTGRTYNGEPNCQHIFGLTDSGQPSNWAGGYNSKFWPDGPLNETQSRIVASSTSWGEHNIWSGQTEEGEHMMPHTYEMWRWFYNELAERMEQRQTTTGKLTYISHNYFWIGQPDAFRLGTLSRQQHKDILTGAASFPATRYDAGSTLADTNLICQGLYSNGSAWAVDQSHENENSLLHHLHKLMMIKKMGKKSLTFLQWFYEWVPNNYITNHLPNGDLVAVQNKIPLPPGYIITAVFMALEFGDGFKGWGSFPNNLSTEAETDWFYDEGLGFRYKANGSSEWVNEYSKKRQSEAMGASSEAEVEKFAMIARNLWVTTFGKMQNGNRSFARFRIDGGSWIEPTGNGTDHVDAFFERRGICVVRQDGNRKGVFYYNQSADNQPHVLEFQFPGSSDIYKANVSTNNTHVQIWE